MASEVPLEWALEAQALAVQAVQADPAAPAGQEVAAPAGEDRAADDALRGQEAARPGGRSKQSVQRLVEIRLERSER